MFAFKRSYKLRFEHLEPDKDFTRIFRGQYKLDGYTLQSMGKIRTKGWDIKSVHC